MSPNAGHKALMITPGFSGEKLCLARKTQLKERIKRLKMEISLIQDERMGYSERLQKVYIKIRRGKIKQDKQELRRKKVRKIKLKIKEFFKRF